ncbi:hypothetical protein ACFOVU_24585 [Nocardiopsis sediminis]|uniref:DUF5709 domain-containing protein n=1 Tax=Nocardiopsis sediminis TaxID=1778267 RepID=A0ABV8FUQ0_9ACTN
MSETPDHPADSINADAFDWEDDGLPAQEDTTEDQPLPAEHPIAMDEYGTTGTEREAGEPLDEALAREVPDVQESDIDKGPENEAIRYPEDFPEDPLGHSAEEQAMHEQEEPGLP